MHIHISFNYRVYNNRIHQLRTNAVLYLATQKGQHFSIDECYIKCI